MLGRRKTAVFRGPGRALEARSGAWPASPTRRGSPARSAQVCTGAKSEDDSRNAARRVSDAGVGLGADRLVVTGKEGGPFWSMPVPWTLVGLGPGGGRQAGLRGAPFPVAPPTCLTHSSFPSTRPPFPCVQYARILQKLSFPVTFKEFKIQNMVGSCDVRFPIRLEGLASSHSVFCSVRARGSGFGRELPGGLVGKGCSAEGFEERQRSGRLLRMAPFRGRPGR